MTEEVSKENDAIGVTSHHKNDVIGVTSHHENGDIESSVHPVNTPQGVNGRRLVTRIDLHVLPALGIVYFMAYLDRLNIGSALIFYLPQDLKLEGHQLNTALAMFFPAYIVLNIPANILIKKIRPRIFLSISMMLFGLVTTFQGLVQNFAGLLAVRVLLGVTEAGVFSGCFYAMSMWYKRAESLRRYTFFVCVASIAGVLGGLLASAIGLMDGARGYRAWRWLFIIEGSLTCVLAIATYFMVSDFPELATWLSEEERTYLRAELRADQGSSEIEKPIGFADVVHVFKDYKLFIGSIMYFCLLVPSYGLAYFIQTIIASFGYSPIQAQLHTIPISVCFLASSILIAYLSDRAEHRFLFVQASLVISIVGCVLLFLIHNARSVQYGCLFIYAIGLTCAIPLVVCWITMNLAGHRRRSVGTAFIIGIGDAGGLLATFSFLATDAPEYRFGYKLSLGMLATSALAAAAYYVACRYDNRKLRKAEEDLSGTEEIIERKGGLDVGYRYFL